MEFVNLRICELDMWATFEISNLQFSRLQVLENLRIGSGSIAKGIERAEKVLGSMQVTTDGGARAKQTVFAAKKVKGGVLAEKKCISNLLHSIRSYIEHIHTTVPPS